MNTKYGLICVSKILKEEDSANSFIGLTRKDYSKLSAEEGDKKALQKLKEDVLHNVDLTVRTIDFCRDSNIDHYRLNTSIFGILSDPSFDIEVTDLPNHQEVLDSIQDIGRTAITKGVSISIQPDKFCKLIDDDESVVEKSIKELDFYSWFLDTIGGQPNISSPLTLHLNSQPTDESHESYCDFADRFFENFKKLEKNTQNRLVLKNADSGSWNAFRLFKYLHVYCFEEYDFGFPLAYNNLFDSLNPSDIDGATVEQQINIGAFHETWGGVVPVFTWSEAKTPGSRAHAADLSFPISDFGYQIKWEVDVTNKDMAILKLFDSDEHKRMSEDALKALTRKKYQRITNNYNALYEAAHKSTPPKK